jgi:putative endonuclease
MFTVYVLYSSIHDKIYIGYTSNLIQRIWNHNFGKDKSFTKNFRPWVVIYCEYFEIKSEAMKREKELKSSQGRKFIREVQINLMKNLNFI